MKALRCLIVVALLIVAAPVMAADDDPTSILPANALAVVRLEKTGAQMLVSAAALPPLAKMFAPEMVSPFAYINGMLKLAPGTVEKAAPHVTGAAFALLSEPDSAGDADTALIVSFDDARWPRELLATLLKDGNVSDICAVGNHIVFSEDTNVTTDLSKGGFPTLAASAHYKAARKQTAESMLWATGSVPALLKGIRTEIRRSDREEMDVISKLLGLDRLTYALLTVKAAGTNASLELTVGLDGKPNKSLLGLLPTGKIVSTAPAPADAVARCALNWGDASQFFGGALEHYKATAQDMAPDEVERLNGQITQIQGAIGVPLDELFGQLGGGVSAFLLPPDRHGMIGRQDWAALLPLKKPDAFRTALRNVFKALNRVTVDANPLPNNAVESVPGMPIFYVVTPNALVVSGSTANVKRAVALKKAPTEGLAMLHLSGGRLTLNYPKPTQNAMLLNVALTRSPNQLKLAAGLANMPALTLTEADRTVLKLRMGTMAMMLMPALTRAREAARKSQGRMTLHNIALGIAHYKEEKGVYPPNLKALFDVGYNTALSEFIAPGDDNPPIVDGMKCSYVYVGTPFPKNAPAGAIICYTRPGVYKDGRNVAFADCGVQFVKNGRFQGIDNPRLKNEFATIAKLLGKAMTNARMHELAKFYGVKVVKQPPKNLLRRR